MTPVTGGSASHYNTAVVGGKRPRKHMPLIQWWFNVGQRLFSGVCGKSHVCFHQTRYFEPMLFKRWPIVLNAGPTFKQH